MRLEARRSERRSAFFNLFILVGERVQLHVDRGSVRDQYMYKRAMLCVIESTVLSRVAAIPELRDSRIISNMSRYGSIRNDKGSYGMPAWTKLFLVNPAATGMEEQQATFRTGEKITRSGIYQVIHRKHRLPHEVTLLRDQEFPRCAKCHDQVRFRLVRAAKLPEVENEFSTHIYLYELPALDDAVEEPIAG